MGVIKSEDSSFKADISKPKVVVKYYADWCGSCKLFSPKFKRLSDDDRFKEVVFLDVNAEQNPEARKIAGVSTLPYFAVFKDGILLDAKSTSKEEVLLDMLSKL